MVERKAINVREQRLENILLSLKKLGFLSRSQIQKIHRLGGERNANRVLKEMSDYLSSFRQHENIYYLNKAGRERVGCEKVMKKTLQATHYLMRNELFIAFGCPANWKSEVKLEIPAMVSVVADAFFVRDGVYHIFEVDHIQKMTVNREKVKKYRKLLELNVFEKRPVFVWLTTTEYRRKQLAKLCDGMNAKIYLSKDFH
ncbi:replication-relaxation family protein [Peribacillus simplex]|uniref:replication-relaxation family protein n=1 Tax=Peribacillus simplex TaxID=1478 RepID=UPI00339E8694